MNPTYQFRHAITRKPAASITQGLRAIDIGTPDLERMQAAHDAYVATLRETGADVVTLPPLPAYPDSVFVEDTALCLPQGAILMRSGAASRAGEVDEMAPTLRNHYKEVRRIKGPGTIEGGDILVTAKEILVGLSDRTNQAGVDELADLLRDWGYKVRAITVPKGVLHFKTDCSLLDGETILSTPRLAPSGCFDGYNVIHTADGEEAGANAIRFNQFVIMAAGFPNTAKRLRDTGYEVREIDNTECAKLDGGMSCLSLRF
ncbi:dimethylarginine dimethylaminohydrolase family protein [Profundibacter sp.]|uniref:dimethylarginine dimethylaminohydrolase family protein n=1 Tax=Profundibacter sp. TaxID=3101071 RepID=UPI003D0A1687